MSSLLQFNGKTGRKGVQLQFVLEKKRAFGFGSKDLDVFRCPICGREHSYIYLAWRKPAGTFGHFVVFRYLGEEHVPDLSIPIGVPKAPRGARRQSIQRSAEIWHS